VQIVLADGGLIVVDSARIEQDQLRGQSEIFADLALPLELVAGVVFRPPVDVANADRLIQRIRTAEGDADRVMLDNGDELTGTVAGIADDVLALDAAAGKVDVPVKKITAVAFNPTLLHRSREERLRAWVGFRGGSRGPASEVSTDGGATRLELGGGGELGGPAGGVVRR